MSIFHTETDADAAIRAKAFEKRQAAKRKEMRRLIYLAKRLGNTVPFSIRDMIELGCGVATIRAVYRNQS